MIQIELTDEQTKLVYLALKEFTDLIWDEPEMIGINVDGYESDQASDDAVLKYINTHINSIIDQMNNQIKK